MHPRPPLMGRPDRRWGIKSCGTVPRIRQCSVRRMYRSYSKANPNSAVHGACLNNRAIARAGQGEYDLAIQDYDEAIKLYPTFAKAFNNRGSTYQKRAIWIVRSAILPGQ